MLNEHRAMAFAAFGAGGSPPVSFPLHAAACNYVQARIKLRGSQANTPDHGAYTVQQLRGSVSHSLYTSGGDNRHTHAYKR